MLAARTAPRFITTAIKVARQATGHVGIFTNKNIFTVATKDRTRKYGARTKDQVLAEFLTKLRIADPAGSHEIVIGDEEDPQWMMVFFFRRAR